MGIKQAVTHGIDFQSLAMIINKNKPHILNKLA